MSAPRRPLAFVFATLVCALSAWGASQAGGWTVQVMALRDYREAQAVAASLLALGFDAYTEFAMDDGQQFVRIRVGCFEERDGADHLALSMASVVTGEAVAVPITPGAEITGCIAVDIGFLKNGDWWPEAAGSPRFEVMVGGESALVGYNGERWTVVQDPADAPPLRASASAGRRIRQVFPSGLQMVRDGPVNICPGRLLAVIADAAIVERSDAVVACRLLGSGGGAP